MSFDPITAALSLGDTLIKRIFPDPSDQAKAQLALLELNQKGELAQIAVNMAEAKHESIFVSGWRPFVGWVCGAAFAYNFVVAPALSFASDVWGQPIPLPTMEMGPLITVLGGMLGLSGMRTFEKFKKVNKER